MTRPYEDQAERAKWSGYNKRLWAVTNYGILVHVANSRKGAIAEAKRLVSGNWRHYYEIRRVTVTEGWAQQEQTDAGEG